MARIDDLLLRVTDPQLRADLASAVAEVRRTTDYGLVYESHLPETCRLPSHPIRRGVKVSERAKSDDSLLLVTSLDSLTAKLLPLRDAKGAALPTIDQTPVELDLSELVVVAEFGDPIYPGLRLVDSVRRGGDKPAHIVINGENYHALQALEFTHAGKVDCVYLDPPYNTGARDWKYNNNYVDENDTYRHSKWLALMERRLRLAKKLLKPDDAVLIVAIDEKEYLRLGLLLEKLFPGARIQMVTTIIKPEGTGRANEFSRTNEFLFFVMIGSVSLTPTADNMFDSDPAATGQAVPWRNLRRRERESVRGSRPNQFYAVFVDETTGRIVGVGEALADDIDRATVNPPPDARAVFPLTPDGREMIWSLVPDRLRDLVARGYARAAGDTIQFLQSGTVRAIEEGQVIVSGLDEHGAVIARFDSSRRLMPKTVWSRESHNAQASGTLLLRRLLPGRHFPFPKSLYAVEDALRFFVASKPTAVVVDFFAGSGTTAHAAFRLNRQDGGSRQSILVTNNEVSADEARSLVERGFRDGDPEWEAQGIFEHITRPRVRAALTGRTPDGEPVTGDYKNIDEFPMADGFDENVEFFELTYQDVAAVELDLAFEAVAPLLWLRAGAEGALIEHRDEAGFAWVERYGVLWDTDRWQTFVASAPEAATTAFIVTDSATAFAAVTSELPAGVEPVRLYENYLTTFAINQVGPE